MNIYDKKYQIFISSTYLDLKKAREEITKVILNLFQIPIGMEMFSADNEEQWSVIQSTIDNSDYYLLIVGHRYGSVTKDNVSYTEKEFDYAKLNNIPIIAFVRNRNIATRPEDRDDDVVKAEKLNEFVNKVLNNSMCDFWENENELGQKVAIALTKMFFKTPRIGWIRSDKSALIETASELTTLIQENRELRERVQKMESLAKHEYPKFKILINSRNSLEFEFDTSLDTSIDELEFDNFPSDLKKFTSKEEVEKYNESIRVIKKEIDVYCASLNDYEHMNKNNFPINVNISNIGNVKGNDLYVDFEFPPEVIVFEKDDLSDLEKPKRPQIPVNPYYVAKRKMEETSLRNITELYRSNSLINIATPIISSSILRSINVNRNFWINKENNTVTVKLSKLTHTRSITINDDILLAPLKKGEFEIKVIIVCDELKQPELTTIPIVIK